MITLDIPYTVTDTSPNAIMVSSPFSSRTFSRPSLHISNANAFLEELPSVIVIGCPGIILCFT